MNKLPLINDSNPALDKFLANCKRQQYPAKETIIHQGDESEQLYYIIKGSVCVQAKDDEGGSIILAYLSAGDFFGEMGLFDETINRSALVVAKEKCNLAVISYDRFRESFDDDNQILKMLTKQMANRLLKTSQSVKNLMTLDVTGRVAAALLELAKQPAAMSHPDGMQINISRQDIAKIVGCSREMAGRVLKNLESDGLISAHGMTIVVFGTR